MVMPVSRLQSANSHGSLSVLLLLLTLFTGVFSTQTQAATFYWDADADATGNLVDGTNVGGTGTWDTITGSW